MKYKVKLALRQKDDSEKAGLGENIYNKMNGNPKFPNPDPALPDFLSATLGYRQAYENALDGGKHVKSILKVKREVFTKLINALGDYVNSIAKGDASIVHSAGMDTNKPREKKQMTQVTSVQGRMGNHTGEVDFTWKPVDGCLVYLGYIKAEGEDDEKYKIKIKTAKTFATVGDLIPGKLYYAVVEAVGSDSVGHLSEPGQARAAY